MPISSRPRCPDCGNAPVNHAVEKANAAVGEFLALLPIPDFSGSVVRAFPPRLVASFLQFLAAMRLGVIVRAPDTATGGRARCIWLEAARRGIDMREFRPFGVSREIFLAKIPALSETKMIIFEGLPRPAFTLSGKKGLPASLAWVDNKPVLKKKFAAAGIPVACGDTAFTWRKAREIFGRLKKQNSNSPRFAVIVKPSAGSRSRHTTIGVTDEASLRQAFLKAKRLSPRVIIEEELEGRVHRGTVIGGKVAGIRRRDPPQVTGDGVHDVRKLIEMENERPERQGPMYWKIRIEDAIEEHVDLDAIPDKDCIVTLSKKTSVYPGIGSTDVTGLAHPDIIALLEKIAAVLDDHLLGADFIVADISRPLADQPRSGIIECNGLPFINLHHFPLHGEPRDAAGALWSSVLKQQL